jgi:hypothetical protein
VNFAAAGIFPVCRTKNVETIKTEDSSINSGNQKNQKLRVKTYQVYGINFKRE